MNGWRDLIKLFFGFDYRCTRLPFFNKKNMKKIVDRFWDFTEKVCEIIYAILLWVIIIVFIVSVVCLIINFI